MREIFAIIASGKIDKHYVKLVHAFIPLPVVKEKQSTYSYILISVDLDSVSG